MLKMILPFLLLLSIIACQSESSNNQQSTSSYSADAYVLPYTLDNPSKTFELPKELKEISGLGLSQNGKHLVAIQDEEGLIFLIDRLKGKVITNFDFWKDGDYEGVEAVGSDIYALKSTGTLYQISEPGSENQKVEKYNTVLSSDNDVEGLCYDKAGNRLLLACKSKAGLEEKYPLKKGIYGFDLKEKKLIEEPAYLISLEAIQEYLNAKPEIRKLEKLVDFFQPNSEGFTFSPSGIAIHPLTGNIYITSSVGKILLVMAPTGKILHLEKLKKKIHAQPEGICFGDDGTLYISNEGKGDKGNIQVFEMHQQ